MFSGHNLKVALEIAEEEDIPRDLVIYQHLTLLPEMARAMVNHCLTGGERCGCATKIYWEEKGLDATCQADCPFGMIDLCKTSHLPTSHELARELVGQGLLGPREKKEVEQTESELSSLVQ